MINFSGKKVLITGGSRGIGKACVEMFAQNSADVIFTYQNKSNPAELLTKKFPEKVKSLKVDLSSEKNIIKAVKDALKILGRIDILVNNAGIWKYGKASEMSLKDWDETLRINLTGSFLFTREVLPNMIKNQYGKIINISSTAGQRGEAFHSHYAASKGGIISFTKSLAAEYGNKNINVNCVAPGWVITDMTKKELKGSNLKSAIEGIPLGRIASPEDIAGAVIFLASDLAGHITGEIINVNGGSVLCG